jgi:8-oxo-dGTP pyrophosphatase MutT (NUDIX family)
VASFAPHRLPAAALRDALRQRLAVPPREDVAPRVGHYSSVDLARLAPLMPAPSIRAAVLLPVIDHGDELGLLFTIRADSLAQHAGQVAFPGGRIEPEDADATAAALRETEEEIGLRRGFIEVVGRLPDHAVITGYRVTPVVGIVRAGFELTLDPTEVAGTFEAPLRHLLDPATHARTTRRVAGVDFETIDLPWGQFNIWGATAGMVLTLREIMGGS